MTTWLQPLREVWVETPQGRAQVMTIHWGHFHFEAKTHQDMITVRLSFSEFKPVIGLKNIIAILKHFDPYYRQSDNPRIYEFNENLLDNVSRMVAQLPTKEQDIIKTLCGIMNNVKKDLTLISKVTNDESLSGRNTGTGLEGLFEPDRDTESTGPEGLGTAGDSPGESLGD